MQHNYEGNFNICIYFLKLLYTLKPNGFQSTLQIKPDNPSVYKAKLFY